jgi:syntaxin 1B/2/3
MHQMFVDMALLVQAQGEIIDNIEVNIKQAKDYVSSGVKQLKSAQVNHEKSRKVKKKFSD